MLSAAEVFSTHCFFADLNQFFALDSTTVME